MTQSLTASFLFDDLTSEERRRAERVESILPELRAHAEEADASGEFYEPHRETLAEAGSFKEARDHGLIRSEGKEYVVQDGDVMLFRFNV